MAGEQYLFGLHALRGLLKKNPQAVKQIWVNDTRRDRRLTEILDLARDAGIPITACRRQELDELANGGAHQGVVALSTASSVANEQTLESVVAEQGQDVFLLILDGVQDPHNLGACLRTADAAGVHAVVAPKDRASGLTPTVRKVSCGAAEAIPFIQVTNLSRTLRWLKEQGVWLVGAAGDAEQTLYDVDLKGPLAFVLGAEGAGLRRLTMEHCDYLVGLPMQGVVESLNVSVATGVCLYEAVRQRSST